jgi:predicted component of type VI protein secretion system
MPTFIGFNTQRQYKKFTLLDTELVKRDLLNGLNIRQGQLPGRPQYGTVLWDNLFENQSSNLTDAIEREIQRVAGYDPRIQILETQVFPQENGILIQIELAIVPSTDAQQLSIFFDQQQRRASYV